MDYTLSKLRELVLDKPATLDWENWPKIEFLKGKSKRGKNPHKPGELTCFKCGNKGRPFGDMADLEINGTRRRLKALCGTCEKPVSLYIGAAKLVEYREVLDIAGSNPL